MELNLMNYKFPTASNMKFSEIKIGSEFSFERDFSYEDILSFAKLTGDFNKIHVDPEFKSKAFKQNIVHGMLSASLFSTLVGMYCPGENCLYLRQEVEFIKPIYPNQKIIVKGTVTRKIEALKILFVKTEIFVDGEAAVKGQAKVKVLE